MLRLVEPNSPFALAVENYVAAAVDWLDVLELNDLVLDLVAGEEVDTVLPVFVLAVSALAVFVLVVFVMAVEVLIVFVLTVVELTVAELTAVVQAVFVLVPLVVFVLDFLLAESHASLVTSLPPVIGLADFDVEVHVGSEAVLPNVKLVMVDLVVSEHCNYPQYLVQVCFGYATSSPVRGLAS